MIEYIKPTFLALNKFCIRTQKSFSVTPTTSQANLNCMLVFFLRIAYAKLTLEQSRLSTLHRRRCQCLLRIYLSYHKSFSISIELCTFSTSGFEIVISYSQVFTQRSFTVYCLLSHLQNVVAANQLRLIHSF